MGSRTRAPRSSPTVIFLHIGKTQSGVSGELAGDYGVLYEITARAANHTAKAARLEIAVAASGGVGRGVYVIAGQLVDTGVVYGFQEKLLLRESLPPGATRSLLIRTIPQAGANYPVTLIVRSPTR